MSFDADLREFIERHHPHGPLTGDATEPTPNGYMVSVGCAFGVVFMRWVMPGDVVEDAIHGRLRKL